MDSLQASYASSDVEGPTMTEKLPVAGRSENASSVGMNMVIHAPPSSCFNSSATPNASSMGLVTLKFWPSIRALVMLRPRTGRVSEAVKSNPKGTRRELTDKMVRL